MTTSPVIRVREAAPGDLQRWDALARDFPNHRVAHTRAWTEFLAASGCGAPVYLLFEKNGDPVGCMPALQSTAGPWRILGSPRQGWQTSIMGPAFDPARVSTAEIIGALIPHLETRYGVSHIELLNSSLDPDVMRNFGFSGKPIFTYRAPLFPGDEARTFKSLKDSARRNIRRAERLGLTVALEQGEGFVDEHYDQLREVYRRSGVAAPFSRRRVHECFHHMQATGNLITASVFLPGGRGPIATGMFFVEGTELLLWTWAHRTFYRWYRPTELMTWTVIRSALARGCDTFDMMGGGIFKTRFGAEPDLSKVRWTRSRPAWLTHARNAIGSAFYFQQSVRGKLGRLAERTVTSLRPGATRRPAACVIGDVDLVRALGLAGIRCDVVAPRGDAARFSRSTRLSMDPLAPGAHPDTLTESLVSYGLQQPEPPVLFYQDDGGLLFVSRQRARLREAFRFVVPQADLVEQLVNKGLFHTLATKLGLPVPASRSLFPGEEAFAGALGLELPVVLKPLRGRDEEWALIAGGQKAISVGSTKVLHALWQFLAERRIPVLAQSLIPGPETRIESYHVYVDERGVVVAEFTGRKIRTSPAVYGDSSALEITDADDVATLGRDVVRRLGLRGVAKLDFKRAPDDRLYLLEVNPRFTLWHHLGARAGVNIPALVYGDLLGQPRPMVPVARAQTRWCKVWKDASAARAAGVPLLHWLRWLSTCQAKSAWAWDDPLPLVRAGVARLLKRDRPSPVDEASPLIQAHPVSG